MKKKKLTRREAALVREAKRKAIEDYEAFHWVRVHLNGQLLNFVTLRTLKLLGKVHKNTYAAKGPFGYSLELVAT